ncbi:hypothetical protein LX36DRAFT_664908 [Colletotrichum falcatum]|nr:hypothetical protein LX36DRAFT_664908 [Colletotrichum falcatum]
MEYIQVVLQVPVVIVVAAAVVIVIVPLLGNCKAAVIAVQHILGDVLCMEIAHH